MAKKYNNIVEERILDEIKLIKKKKLISLEDIECLKAKIERIIAIGSFNGVEVTEDFYKTIEPIFAEIEKKAINVAIDKKLIEEGIKSKSKYKLDKKAKIVIATGVATVAIGLAALAASKFGNSSDDKTADNSTQNIKTTLETVSVNEVVGYTSMSEETLALTKEINLSIDEALSKGLLSDKDTLLEEDKATYADAFTKYSLLINSDSYSNIEWATLFGEQIDPSEELIENFFNVNTEIKKHLIVVKSDNILDYSKLGFKNEKSAALLTDSERLIAKLNETKGSERKQAAKDWYAFATEFLATTEGDINYDEYTLDLLITQSEAFDELTRSYGYGLGASIDDELEHALNTAKDNCVNYLSGTKTDSNINVEEVGIENEKSVLRIKMVNKLADKYTAAINEHDLQITMGNELNEFDSFENVVETVKDGIDLNLYVKRADYIAAQLEAKGITKDGKPTGAVVNKDDSGIPNTQGTGNISEAQLAATNTTTAAELEAAVQADFEKQAAANAVIDYNTKNAAIQKGAADANANLAANPGSVDSSLAEYYTGGYNAAKATMNSIQQQQTNQTFEDTPDVVEKSTTTAETVTNYTGDTQAAIADNVNIESSTTFVPLDENNATPEKVEVKTLVNPNQTDKSEAINYLLELKQQLISIKEILADVRENLDIVKKI